MHINQIMPGKTYVGRTGRKRRVMSDDNGHNRRHGAKDEVNVIDLGARGLPVEGSSINMTKAAFARWAVREAVNGEITP
jgi:hypothetical protein